MKSFIIAIVLFNAITNLNSQVNVIDLIPGNDVVITLKNGSIFKGNAWTQENNILKVISLLKDEYFIEFDSIQNIYSNAHKNHEYLFPGIQDFSFDSNKKLKLYFKNGETLNVKYVIHDKEHIHVKLKSEGIYKYKISSIHYIKSKKTHSKAHHIHGGLAYFSQSFLSFNLDSDIKILESKIGKSLLHFGIGMAVSYGGSVTYGKIGITQCFGRNGKYFEMSGGLIFTSESRAQFSLGYRSEKNNFIFRTGTSLIVNESTGFYISFGF